MKFKVGDIITGLPESSYCYKFTTDEAEMKVLRVNCNKTDFGDDLEVEIIKNNNYKIVGEVFFVQSKYFVKVNKEIDDENLVIKKVIFSGNKTIVFWTDGTKTVVTCAEGDQFSKEAGIAFACMKKYLGNNTVDYHRYFDKFRGE